MNPIYRRVAIVLVLLMVIALLGGFFASIARTAPSLGCPQDAVVFGADIQLIGGC